MQDQYIDGLQCPQLSRDYLQQAKQAKLRIVHITVCFWQNCYEAINDISQALSVISSNSDLAYLACNYDGLVYDTNDDRVGIIFGFQNCSPIENNIHMLEIFKRIGVGCMQLSYNNQSHLAGGCYETVPTGVSRFGKEVIGEMNRIGMIIDMSHSSEMSTLETIELSSRPIAITHAQSSSFQRSKRNKSDQLIKLVAQSGGILGLSFYPFHLKNHGKCTLAQLIDEICRLTDMIGIEHLSIGSDLCYGQPASYLSYMRNGSWTKQEDFGESPTQDRNWPAAPTWYSAPEHLAQIKFALVESGFTQADADLLFFGNWARFFKQQLAAHQ